MSQWPLDIENEEVIVRGVCSPYHVKSSGKLKFEAFMPTPKTDEVSVMRHNWIGSDECKLKSKQLEDVEKKKIYKGLAYTTALKVRQLNLDIVDSRDLFNGHADIKHNIIIKPYEPLPPEVSSVLRLQAKKLVENSIYLEDPQPDVDSWQGPPII